MPMQTQKELFIHELGDIYDAEQRLAQILPTMTSETQDPEIKKALKQHASETKQQISNIEQCFKVVGAKPNGSACLVIDGLKKEHDQFVQEKPSPEILSVYNLSATEKAEHYEIASYIGLIDTATILGEKECAKLLKQNLDQEEAMAEKIMLFSREQKKLMAGQIDKNVDISDIE